MRSIDMLLEDHRQIERLLKMLAGAVTKLRAGEPVDGQVFQKAAEFLHGYADQYHHVREETHLFPVLEGYPLLTMAGRLDCMPGEHEIGRGLIARLQDASDRYAAGDAAAADEIADAAGNYLQLLSHHMGVEEGVLFELADRVVADEDDESIANGLEQIATAQREAGQDMHFRALLDELESLAVGDSA